MNMGFSNAIIDDFNAYTFSLMGMLIVFVGLVLIYLYIEFLPYFLDFLSKRKEKIKQRARIRFKKETASPKHLSSANFPTSSKFSPPSLEASACSLTFLTAIFESQKQSGLFPAPWRMLLQPFPAAALQGFPAALLSPQSGFLLFPWLILGL